MSDELNENLDSEQVEDTIQDTEIDTADLNAEDPEVLKARIAELEGKNKQLYERVKKVEKPKDLTTNQSPPVTREDYQRLDLKTDGYSRDEVEFLMQNGGQKALENPIVMAGIEAIRKKAKSQDATPSGTAKSAVYQKFTEQDLKKMPLDELEKIVPQ